MKIQEQQLFFTLGPRLFLFFLFDKGIQGRSQMVQIDLDDAVVVAQALIHGGIS